MLFPAPQDWTAWGVSSGLEKLFVLLWSELFDDTTLDTWQPRTSNIRSVLEEIVRACEIAREYEPYGHNIPELLREADLIASMDPILTKHFPHVREYLAGLTKDDPRKKLEAVQRRAVVLLGHLHSYRDAIVSTLRELVAAGDARQKEDLLRLGMTLGTELSVTGYSDAHLLTGLTILQDPSLEFPARVDALLHAFSGVEKLFDCTYALRGPTFIARLATKNVRYTLGPPAALDGADEEAFFAKAAPTDLFATVRVNALDPLTARDAAAPRIASMIAAVAAFERETTVSLKGTQLLVRPRGERAQLVALTDTRRFYAPSSRDAEKRVVQLVHLQNAMRDDDREQLDAALQYHRLAIGAQTDEARLVNLWVALESLLRRSEGASIIERLSSHVPQAVALTNVPKIVTGLAIYLRHYWAAHGIERFRPIFEHVHPKRLAPADLLEVLLETDDGPRINALLAAVHDHPLLVYRLYRYKVRTLKSGESVATNLSHHRQNVDWQLRRIYRSRNEVIHRAYCPRGTAKLLVHLHAYFIQLVDAIIHNLRTAGKAWSIPDALEHRRLLFDHLLSELSTEKTRITRSALLDPARSLGAAQGYPAWPLANTRGLFAPQTAAPPEDAPAAASRDPAAWQPVAVPHVPAAPELLSAEQAADRQTPAPQIAPASAGTATAPTPAPVASQGVEPGSQRDERDRDD
jgi:hypothetical protein